MGVHGLWRLLEATGKPVPVETLDGKVLGVDVSIWIHQVLQGYQDRRGNPLPNAHLLGLFNRICKLLYYRIKPVFVFDGGVPLLKKNTIASRRKLKSTAASKAQRMKNDLINNLLKHSAVKGALASESPEKKRPDADQNKIAAHSSNLNDMFKLPLIPSTDQDLSESDGEEGETSDTDSSGQLSPRKQTRWIGNIHSVDVNSAEFRNLPADVRHDILTDLKETRKQNSWGRLHEIPEESNDFSQYQMKRLLKRRYVQESLEEAEKEMGGKTLTLEELNTLLTEQGIDTTSRDTAYRIAANNTTRMIYINGLKKTNENKASSVASGEENAKLKTVEEAVDKVPLVEEIIDVDDDEEYFVESEWENDWESDNDERTDAVQKMKKGSGMNPAMAYMLEHSGLSQQQILSVIELNKIKKEKEEEEDEVPVKKSKKDKPSHGVSVKSDSESDDLVEVEDAPGVDDSLSAKNVDSAKNNISVEESVVKQDSVSDTESDDFVQVEDVFIPDVDSVERKVQVEELKITVKPGIELEDDLFADVFAVPNTQAVTNLNNAPGDEVNKTSEELPGENLEERKIAVTEDVPLVTSGKEDSHSTNVQQPEASGNITRIAENVQPETSGIATETVEREAMKLPVDREELLSMKQPETSENITRIVENVQPETSGITTRIVDNVQPETSGIVTETVEREAIKLPVDREELLSMKVQLESEQKDLTGDIGRLQRQATDVTDQMRLEAQELLRLFGIPFIIAPMEAEAQCAHLESINLTDGTITDDSDIWLFGGRCVYKNFFNHNKHVLQFRSSDIQHHFKLTREQMVQLALLVGSDYTTGVNGIGPVTALEILASFPSDGSNLLRGLVNFRCWIRSGRMAGPGRAGLRNKLRNIKIEKGFPSEAVVQAYLTPTVDESKESFTWNKPNMVLLCDYTREKFGWSRMKFEETLAPVMKKYEEPKKQKGIDSYFLVKTSLKSIEGNLSKRVQKAVQRLGFEESKSDDDPEAAQNPDQETKRAKTNRNNSKDGKKRKCKKKGDATVSEAQNDIAMPDEVEVPNVIEMPAVKIEEVIPQREKDKANALKKKLRAIEVFRKSKKGPGYMKKSKRGACKIKEEADLSESSSSS